MEVLSDSSRKGQYQSIGQKVLVTYFVKVSTIRGSRPLAGSSAVAKYKRHEQGLHLRTSATNVAAERMVPLRESLAHPVSRR